MSVHSYSLTRVMNAPKYYQNFHGCVILFPFVLLFLFDGEAYRLIELTKYDLANISNVFDRSCRKKVQRWPKTKCQSSCAHGHITERSENISSNVSLTPGCITCNLNKTVFSVNHWVRTGVDWGGHCPPQIFLVPLQKIWKNPADN